MANKDKDSLGNRMKQYYEAIPKIKLMRRTPVIIRIDGKAFHTFTKGFNRPYDVVLSNAMIKTMKYLCKNVQGCVLGYTQSDEITLVLVDYKELNTNAWFDYEVQKVSSISASMATLAFNQFFKEEVDYIKFELDNIFKKKIYIERPKYDHDIDKLKEDYNEYVNEFCKRFRYDTLEDAKRCCEKYESSLKKGAMFDSRVFNIPKEEVCNCVIWRQQDASRNSVEMLGRHYFSDKQLFKKNCSDIQDMLMNEHSVNWNDVPTKFKRGTSCYKRVIKDDKGDEHAEWFIDYEMPILTQDRDYVEKHIFINI